MPRVVFADRPVLVTGASGGIGSEIARALARRGARLALAANRSGPLEALAAELRGLGVEASVHVCDVGERESMRRVVDEVVRLHGGLGGVVASAGIGRQAAFHEHSLDEIERLVRVNLMGVLHAIHFALPHVSKAGGGFLVNLSSVAGRLGQPGESVYSATKFAVTGLSEALAIELAERGVHVLSVHPGLVRTGFFSEEELARIPASVKRGAIDPAPLAESIVRALERGRHEITVPGYAAGGYVLRALAPGAFRRILRRVRRGPT
jgi:short-subunit dehydrogenase